MFLCISAPTVTTGIEDFVLCVLIGLQVGLNRCIIFSMNPLIVCCIKTAENREKLPKMMSSNLLVYPTKSTNTKYV